METKFNNLPSLIKWTGSKRYLVKEISSYIKLKDIDIYYEPFLGSGSLALYLLLNKDININKFILSDFNNDLINFWNTIKNNPDIIINGYEKHWKEFNKNNDILKRKEYYNNIRKEFNITRDVILFYFLTRTSTNGMIRYNKKNEFNVSCHFTRPGMQPNKIKNNILYINKILLYKNIIFKNSSYDFIKKINKNDLLFLDPPYLNSKELYFGNFDFEKYFNWLKNINKYYNVYMTFDNINNINDLYKNHLKNIFKNSVSLQKTKSSFLNLNKKNQDTNESLFF